MLELFRLLPFGLVAHGLGEYGHMVLRCRSSGDSPGKKCADARLDEYLEDLDKIKADMAVETRGTKVRMRKSRPAGRTKKP